jgi:hypothetical protein
MKIFKVANKIAANKKNTGRTIYQIKSGAT